MPDLTLDPSTTALVLIDLQRGITSRTTAPRPSSEVVDRARQLAHRFRQRNAPVILVRVDPGSHFELFPRMTTDVPRPIPTGALPPDWTEIVPELSPAASDIVVTKHQPGAFFCTDLDVHLRRRGVRTIVLAGISTNIGVESTARVAFELGYEQVFVEDAMAALEADLHIHAVTRFFPTIGRVRSTAQVLAALA